MSIFDVLGPTAIPTLICLCIGLVLLLIEFFTPGVGVAGITGVVCLAAVIIMQVFFGSATAAFYIAGGSLIVIVIALILFIRSLQKGRLSKSFIVLNDTISESSGAAEAPQAKSMLGKKGIAITHLRPSGIAMIDGVRTDVMTSGDFLEKDAHVVVSSVQGLTIFVSPDKGETRS